MKKGYFFIVFILLGAGARCQDLEFSQYLNNPVYLNPGMAGSTNNGPRFVLNYRNQWPQLGSAFSSYSVSYDQQINSISGGISFQVLEDQMGNGVYDNLAVTGGYNYIFKLSDKTAVRAGMQVSFLQSHLDWSKLLFGDQIDPATVVPAYQTGEQIPSSDNKVNADIGAGFLIYGKKAYLGLGVKHINQPDLSFYADRRAPLPVRFAVNLGTEFKTKRNGKTYISPNLVLVSQSNFKEVVGYVMLTKGPVILGIGERTAISNSDALIFYVGFKTGIFKIMYSYDSSLGYLSGISGGANEVSLIITPDDGKKSERKRSIKNSIQCPDIF